MFRDRNHVRWLVRRFDQRMDRHFGDSDIGLLRRNRFPYVLRAAAGGGWDDRSFDPFRQSFGDFL